MKNKKRANQKKRRVLLSLLLICLTAVVLSTSTYAWFTANKTITVSKIDVSIASTNGVQVSVDGINWKAVISNSDITGASGTYTAAVNQLPASSNSLSPVSTIGEIETTETGQVGFLKMFAGTIDTNDGGQYILHSNRSVETNTTASGNFIAFDMFISVTEDTDLYLTSASNVTASGTSTGIENASRIAFVIEGNTPAGSPTATIQGLKASTGSEEVVLWELNSDVHTAAGVMNASNVYGLTTTETSATPLSYYGVKAPITANDVLLNSQSTTYFSAVTPDLSTPASGIPSTAYLKALELSAGITKVRVYMWIEGQDVDCENNASGGSVSFNVQLSSNTAE